jgi:hypothetical protein
MERRSRIDDIQQEGTTKSIAKAGPRSWEKEKYIYKEEPEDAKRPLHGDPRLKLALQSQHQDSDFIPHDSDHESLHPAFGFGVTNDFSASTSSAGDLGTLAGTGTEEQRQIQRKLLEQIRRKADESTPSPGVGHR